LSPEVTLTLLLPFVPPLTALAPSEYARRDRALASLRCSEAATGMDPPVEMVNLRRGARHGGGVVIGVLLIGVLCAVCFSYACTEYLMTRFDIRRRATVAAGGVWLILAVNLCSLILLWLIASILVAASGYHQLYLQLAVISLGSQAIWLVQHLWSYRRDHVRVRYEN
jgi:hypothetical protein